MPAPPEFLSYIKEHQQSFVDRLIKAVSYPSVSGEPTHSQDLVDMAEWLEGQLCKYGVATKCKTESLDSKGEKVKIPPVIFGRVGQDREKKTVLVYGHYDVQPALEDDGWESDPFVLVERDGKLVGRGSSDDKGPILGWLNVLEAIHEQELELPVNLLFVFEGMEESGSTGLHHLIEQEAGANGWLQGVDCVCISDNYWLNNRTPCVTYGLRGITYYRIIVEGPRRDLHSGEFGGMVHEPMTDLIAVMSRLVGSDGKILIPGIQDLVPPPSSEEEHFYEQLDYSLDDLENAVGRNIALSDDKKVLLMGRMREPSLSLHGIEGASSGSELKTVIPARVMGKFSIRLVPNQTPETVNTLIEKYINAEFKKLNSRNLLTVAYQGGGEPWRENPDSWVYKAAKRATQAIYNQQPDMTREGGSIPVTLTFANALGAKVLLLPMGRGDDGAHSTNEKLDRTNFIEGSKLLGTYLWEVAAET